MNADAIRKNLETQLQTLETSNHQGAGHLNERWNTAHLRARLKSVDRLACEFELVSASSPSISKASSSQLCELADQLTERLTYLEESLVVLEVDEQAPEVQLRSSRPRQESDRRSYFEVLVSRQGITVGRYQKRTGSARTPLSAVVSRDILCRLCVDLLDAAQALA